MQLKLNTLLQGGKKWAMPLAVAGTVAMVVLAIHLWPNEVETSSPTGRIFGHGYVDLGLSVKWADRNMGASSPSDYGSYYAWGEKRTKFIYISSTSKTWEANLGDIAGNSRYDAARANWGSSWRLPTKAECEELKNKCTWTWGTQGGHSGYKVTGPNGNSIFLPIAGFYHDTSLNYAEEDGCYWSSTPDESDTWGAYSLYFSSDCYNVGWDYRYVGWGYRFRGHSIRPVSE